MTRNVFYALVVGVLLCSSIAYAGEIGFEGGIGGFIGDEETVYEQYPLVEGLAIPEDVSACGLTQYVTRRSR
ncbi:MAG: hypothetical protein LBS45_08325 [Synergistaceae bacterium]|jgi:hypothetical protein|nr:hypothetical protein [Synergistaceae bacterium]